MRLYLSSFRNGNKPEEFLRLIGREKRTAVITNAMDMVDDDTRAQSVVDEIRRLKEIGLEPVELDLRKYFGKADELQSFLESFNVTWARGGNTFILRRAYKQSGFDELLKELLEKDALVYAGYSAGICLLAPTLRGLDIVDDPTTAPADYSPEIIWEGLGILSYSIAPHYKSDHPESADVDRTVEYFKANHMPYKALRDGEVILIHGTKERILG